MQRCKVGLARKERRPKETITALWYDLIPNIGAQYEELEGTSDTMEDASLFFQQSWSDSPKLVDYVDGMPKWCYTTPKWLFPTWQPNQKGTWYFSEILHIVG